MKLTSYPYGQVGPGGGSLPGDVMRTGIVAPFDPRHVRHDIQVRAVEDATRIPVGRTPSIVASRPGTQIPAMPAPAPVAPTPAEAAGFGKSVWTKKIESRERFKKKLAALSPEQRARFEAAKKRFVAARKNLWAVRKSVFAGASDVEIL